MIEYRLIEVVLKHFEKINGSTKLTEAQEDCLSKLKFDIAHGIDMNLKLYHDTIMFLDTLKQNRKQLKAPTNISKMEKNRIIFSGSSRVLFLTRWDVVTEALGYKMSDLYRCGEKDQS